MKKLIWSVVLGVFLSGCATTYHKQTWTDGYSDMKLQDDVFKVSFKGNAYCGKGRTENFAMLRCAEVALNNGYNYFVIVEGGTDLQTGSYTTPVTAQTYGTATGTGYSYGNYTNYSGTYSGATHYSGGQTYTFRKPTASYTIKCFKEKPENIPAMVYDARQIEKNISEQYRIN